jgi:hypothetical protein
MLIRRIAIGVMVSCMFSLFSLLCASSDTGALLILGIALVTVGLLVGFGIAERGRRRLKALLMLAAFLVLPTLLLSNYSLIRDHARWLLLSASYKSKVFSQPADGKLKHAEWDSWGFAGVGDTVAYLVFDASDSLLEASESGPPVKAAGLPCEVHRVRRLDRQWYIVLFYSDTFWGTGSCK